MTQTTVAPFPDQQSVAIYCSPSSQIAEDVVQADASERRTAYDATALSQPLADRFATDELNVVLAALSCWKRLWRAEAGGKADLSARAASLPSRLQRVGGTGLAADVAVRTAAPLWLGLITRRETDTGAGYRAGQSALQTGQSCERRKQIGGLSFSEIVRSLLTPGSNPTEVQYFG